MNIPLTEFNLKNIGDYFFFDNENFLQNNQKAVDIWARKRYGYKSPLSLISVINEELG
ncbi:hypothetical protein LCGC14_0625490 [marine sediment metagenome]|uniref:Uncharacterized protein n=1 Tax=marine sediment metagenome TaxID=412755 RepID=A0A0F9R8K6_9ZZZZ